MSSLSPTSTTKQVINKYPEPIRELIFNWLRVRTETAEEAQFAALYLIFGKNKVSPLSLIHTQRYLANFIKVILGSISIFIIFLVIIGTEGAPITFMPLWDQSFLGFILITVGWLLALLLPIYQFKNYSTWLNLKSETTKYSNYLYISNALGAKDLNQSEHDLIITLRILPILTGIEIFWLGLTFVGVLLTTSTLVYLLGVLIFVGLIVVSTGVEYKRAWSNHSKVFDFAKQELDEWKNRFRKIIESDVLAKAELFWGAFNDKKSNPYIEETLSPDIRFRLGKNTKEAFYIANANLEFVDTNNPTKVYESMNGALCFTPTGAKFIGANTELSVSYETMGFSDTQPFPRVKNSISAKPEAKSDYEAIGTLHYENEYINLLGKRVIVGDIALISTIVKHLQNQHASS